MRTRPASIATIVITIGLALTAIGIARGLPYAFGGQGERASVGADAWAHGTAVSPPIVALVVLGLLAAIAMRPTRGGRRAAAWLAVLAGAVLLAAILEPATARILLLANPDAVLTSLAWTEAMALVALVLSAAGEARGGNRIDVAVRRRSLARSAPMAATSAA